MLVHVWFPLQLKELIVLSNITSVTRRLTNAFAIVVFDRDTNVHAECLAPLVTCLTPCDVAVGALSWLLTCFDGGRCHGWFTCCFDPCCQKPGELTQTQLARVELVGVHRELKDMDVCQHISYIAHILQVQLRIRDRGPSPLTAHPTICPPGAGSSAA